MDSFHDKDLIFPQSQFLSYESALSFYKVKYRDLYGLTVQQLLKLPVEERDVHGLKVFIIVFSFCIARRIFAVYKVIVHFQHNGLHAHNLQLGGNAFGCCCFATAGRTGYQHQLHVLAFGQNGICNGRITSFMESLPSEDEVFDFFVLNLPVKASNVFYPHNITPLHIFFKDIGQFMQFWRYVYLVGAIRLRILK